MFNLFADSIFNPKALVKYLHKKKFYVFIYMLILAILMSLGTIILLLTSNNTPISEATTGCRVTNYSLVCDGDNYNIDNGYYLYGFRAYFLNQDYSIDDLVNMDSQSIIFQGSELGIYINGAKVRSIPIFTSTTGITDFDMAMNLMVNSLLVSGIIISIISNLGLLIIIIFFSTLVLLRFRKTIKYSKIFKLITFATTPVAVFFTLNNLLHFSNIIFFILLFISYRSVFVIQRELNYQVVLRNTSENEPQDLDNDLKDQEADSENDDSKDDKIE